MMSTLLVPPPQLPLLVVVLSSRVIGKAKPLTTKGTKEIAGIAVIAVIGKANLTADLR